MRSFDSYTPGLDSPALGALAVTPSDTLPLAQRVRALTLNGAGTLSVIGWDGAVSTTGPLPAGTYALCATHVRASGTTATGITGWI
jgi:hypothetical protein